MKQDLLFRKKQTEATQHCWNLFVFTCLSQCLKQWNYRVISYRYRPRIRRSSLYRPGLEARRENRAAKRQGFHVPRARVCIVMNAESEVWYLTYRIVILNCIIARRKYIAISAPLKRLLYILYYANFVTSFYAISKLTYSNIKAISSGLVVGLSAYLDALIRARYLFISEQLGFGYGESKEHGFRFLFCLPSPYPCLHDLW